MNEVSTDCMIRAWLSFQWSLSSPRAFHVARIDQQKPAFAHNLDNRTSGSRQKLAIVDCFLQLIVACISLRLTGEKTEHVVEKVVKGECISPA